jgi:NADPH:quinone reductase-like Zn-dependent oxidoreductase
MRTMRALEAGAAGEPSEVLRLTERPIPTIGPHQVLVRMLASPIHPSDLHTVRGVYGVAPAFPVVLGSEGVGIIEAVGSEVADRKVGDRVVTIGVLGTWQEFVAADSNRAIPIPPMLSLSTAAQLITNPLTALLLTTRELRAGPGELIAQTAAGSIVGRMVIQLAANAGVKTINLVRRRDAVDEIRALGGTQVVCTADEDVVSRLAEITDGAGVAKALDCVGGETGAAVARSMAAGGTMVVYGALSTHRKTDPSALTLPLFTRSLIYGAHTVRGWWLMHWFKTTPPADVKAMLSDLIGRVAKQEIVVPEGLSYGYDRLRDALYAAESVARGPKVLLQA